MQSPKLTILRHPNRIVSPLKNILKEHPDSSFVLSNELLQYIFAKDPSQWNIWKRVCRFFYDNIFALKVLTFDQIEKEIWEKETAVVQYRINLTRQWNNKVIEWYFTEWDFFKEKPDTTLFQVWLPSNAKRREIDAKYRFFLTKKLWNLLPYFCEYGKKTFKKNFMLKAKFITSCIGENERVSLILLKMLNMNKFVPENAILTQSTMPEVLDYIFKNSIPKVFESIKSFISAIQENPTEGQEAFDNKILVLENITYFNYDKISISLICTNLSDTELIQFFRVKNSRFASHSYFDWFYFVGLVRRNNLEIISVFHSEFPKHSRLLLQAAVYEQNLAVLNFLKEKDGTKDNKWIQKPIRLYAFAKKYDLYQSMDWLQKNIDPSKLNQKNKKAKKNV